MNVFRLIGDLLHLLSFFILIKKIHGTKNVIGLSYKTQEIYLIVFLTRYFDILLYWVSLYNTSMKIIFICATIYVVYLIRFKPPYCYSYDGNIADDFQHYKIIYPAAIAFTIMLHTQFTPFEMIWSFSIWLEALAIIPQLHMIAKHKEIENITSNYIAALGFYRFFYILNWLIFFELIKIKRIYKYALLDEICWTSIVGGTVQTILYADFLYYFIISKSQGKQASLPE